MSSALESWRRSVASVAGLSIALAVLADWLFYRQPIGWTPALFALAVATAILLRPGSGNSARVRAVLAAGIAGLAVAMLLHRGAIAVTGAAALLVLLGVTQRCGWVGDCWAWLRRAGALLLLAPVRAFLDSRIMRRFAQRRRGRRLRAAVLMAAWMAPLLFVLVFAGLFVAANPVISNWAQRAWQETSAAAQNLWRHIAPFRVMLWLAVGVSAWALLRFRARARRGAAAQRQNQRIASRINLASLLKPTAVTPSLAVFNALFAVQTAMDVYYLFGGGTLPAGMSHAEYAHRGAYPLVATALLAGLFCLLAFPGVRTRPPLRWTRRLLVIWVAQNVFLLFTAAWRLWLYVDAYSLTRWRVAAAIWMLIVALGLICLLWRIVAERSNRWLANASIVMAGVILYACAFVPFDQLIADFNVTHCREIRGRGEGIDLGYLEGIGPEALPAVQWLATSLSPGPLRGHLSKMALRLEERLDEQLRNWRGWTWQHASIREAAQADALARGGGDPAIVTRRTGR
jgi:hypothetical protein